MTPKCPKSRRFWVNRSGCSMSAYFTSQLFAHIESIYSFEMFVLFIDIITTPQMEARTIMCWCLHAFMELCLSQIRTECQTSSATHHSQASMTILTRAKVLSLHLVSRDLAMFSCQIMAPFRQTLKTDKRKWASYTVVDHYSKSTADGYDRKEPSFIKRLSHNRSFDCTHQCPLVQILQAQKEWKCKCVFLPTYWSVSKKKTIVSWHLYVLALGEI